MKHESNESFEQSIQSLVDQLKAKGISGPFEWSIILGSGLGAVEEILENKTNIFYHQLESYPASSVEGHAGILSTGVVAGKKVLLFQGRSHIYEGHSAQVSTTSIYLSKALGCHSVFLTNAAGGIHNDFHPGDLVLIRDHVNMSGQNPLLGPNTSFGPRFPDMSAAYFPDYQKSLQAISKELSFELKEGVYCYTLGPCYETPAEIRMMSIIGCDMVGMSTVPEVIAANHCGLKVAGISCITNYASGKTPDKLNHNDVKETAQKSLSKLKKIIMKMVSSH